MITDDLDNLRLEIRITDDPEEKYALIVDLAKVLYDRGDYQEALDVAREALALAEKTENARFKAGALRMIGGLEELLMGFAAGMGSQQRALRIYRTLGDREGEATMLLNMGITHYGLGEHAKALKMLDECREILGQIHRPGLMANALMTSARLQAMLGNIHGSLAELLESLAIVEATPGTDIGSSLLVNIGCTYSDAGEPEEAERYWLRALEAAREAGHRDVERRALMDLAALYRSRRELERAVEHLELALAIARDMRDAGAESQAMGEIGTIHHLRGDNETALQYLYRALDSSRKLGEKLNELYAMLNIGIVVLATGRSQEGIAQLEESLALCRNIGARSREWEICLALSEAYDAAGDIARAYEHFRAYANAKEEVMGKEQQKAIENLRTRHEIETARKERDIFRLENEKLQIELHGKNNELTSMALHLVQKNETLEKLKDEVVQMVNVVTGDARSLLRRLVPLIQQSIGSEQEWSAFEQRFAEVHPGFAEALLAHASDLSPTELRVASLLRIQMNTKEIATLMSVTTRAIEKHRLQMRKKLGLDGSSNLPAFLATLA